MLLQFITLNILQFDPIPSPYFPEEDLIKKNMNRFYVTYVTGVAK